MDEMKNKVEATEEIKEEKVEKIEKTEKKRRPRKDREDALPRCSAFDWRPGKQFASRDPLRLLERPSEAKHPG